MAFWVHVEKGYIIFTVYFSSFKSLESLARLLKKVLKSCETFKIQDFANANSIPIFSTDKTLAEESYYHGIFYRRSLRLCWA